MEISRLAKFETVRLGGKIDALGDCATGSLTQVACAPASSITAAPAATPRLLFGGQGGALAAILAFRLQV